MSIAAHGPAAPSSLQRLLRSVFTFESTQSIEYPWFGAVMPSVVPYWYLRTGFFEYVQSFTHVLQIGVDVSASDDDGQPGAAAAQP